jgi:hypothetical protein
MSTQPAIYLYGITQDAPKKPVRAQGVDGEAAVEPVPCVGFTCWISRVDRREFADDLNRNMENLEWLAAAGVRHQRVVADIAAQATVLPARFGTVFLTEKSLQEDVKKRKRVLSDSLKMVAGADEWGVKVFLLQPAQPAALNASSGTDYLRKKATAQQKGRVLDNKEIEAFAVALARLAQGMAPAGKVSSGQRDLEWSASFLLQRAKKKQWQQVLDRFAKKWRGSRRIECTGPWPPYSFVSTHGH